MTPAASTRPRISREFLEEHRRRRFVDATAEILHEFGRPGATTTNVVRLAGGARNSFYEVFSSVEDCIGYGIGVADTEIFACLAEPAGTGDWPTELLASIRGFYEAVAAKPVLAELVLVHAGASRTQVGRDAFGTAGARFAALIERGRAEAEARDLRPPPSLVVECLSRAIVSLAEARVRGPEVETLPAQAAEMALLVGGYYLGPDLAERRLAEAPAAA